MKKIAFVVFSILFFNNIQSQNLHIGKRYNALWDRQIALENMALPFVNFSKVYYAYGSHQYHRVGFLAKNIKDNLMLYPDAKAAYLRFKNQRIISLSCRIISAASFCLWTYNSINNIAKQNVKVNSFWQIQRQTFFANNALPFLGVYIGSYYLGNTYNRQAEASLVYSVKLFNKKK